MEDAPLISVIVPVYNCEHYLSEAIESILAQSYHPMEVIVVDDGSTDGTAGVAQQYLPRVRYCYQANEGTGAARNQGIELASGEFLAFLDADDIWFEEKLMRQMAVFQADAQVDLVFGHVKQFYSPELDERIKQEARFHAEVMPAHLPCAMLAKRESFLKVGMFDTSWQVGQDVDWYMRAREQQLKAVMLPDLVYKRRLHATNKGITQRQFGNQRLHQLKASLDRRRKMAAQD
jgi:glycosyltransferase involved in cell wall biosynthesis